MTGEPFYEIEAGLRLLRHCASAHSPSRLALFDEFVREQEYGLALELIGDTLRAHDKPLFELADLQLIERLHALMDVIDDCAVELRAKLKE